MDHGRHHLRAAERREEAGGEPGDDARVHRSHAGSGPPMNNWKLAVVPIGLLSLLTLSAPSTMIEDPSVPSASHASLQSLLEAELARFPGRAGVWVKHLTTGEEAGVRADEVFNSASVIKLPVLVLAFEMVE